MKKLLISFISIILIISSFAIVYAAEGTITASASTNSVIKGKSFTVTITGNADSDITGLASNIEYDKNILKLDSINPSSGFTNSSDGTKLEIASISTSTFTSGSIVVLNFTVLDTTTANSATVTISNGILALLKNEVQTNVDNLSASVTIEIKEDSTTAGGTENPGNTDTPNNPGANTPDNTDKNTPDNQEPKKDTIKSENTDKTPTSNSGSNSSSGSKKTTKKLPQTGLDTTVLFAIAGISIFGVVSYITYKKYKMN